MEKQKRPIYLWILLVLSSLGTVNGLFGLLGGLMRGAQEINTEQLTEAYKALNMSDEAVNQMITFTQRSAEVNQNILVYLFPVIFAVAMIAAWIFFVKRDIAKTNFIYLGYLILHLVSSIYSYVVNMNLVNSILTDQEARMIMVVGGQVLTFVGFGIYIIFIGIVLYKIWRQNQAIEEE